MNTENKTLSEILAENLSYYVNDTSKRCVAPDGDCKYSGKTLGLDTDGCFVGRFLSEEDRLKADTNSVVGAVSSLVTYHKETGITIPDIIYNHTQLFSEFQWLHDNSLFWITNSLSDTGKSFLQKIILDINWT